MAPAGLLELLSLGAERWNVERADVKGMAGVLPDVEVPYDGGIVMLTPSDLLDADLRWAEINNGDLSGYDLSAAILDNALCAGALFASADLREATLTNLWARGADFRDARLQDADFRNADLAGAKFERSQLEGADFRGARLHGANLRTYNLDSAKLERALVDRQTVFPPGFDTDAAGVIFEEVVPPDREVNGTYTARVETLDEETRRLTIADFEPLMQQVTQMLDDPSLRMDPDRELDLRADLDTIRGQLRSTQPDVVILERAGARLIRAVTPARPALDQIVTALAEQGVDVDDELPHYIQELTEEAAEFGSEDVIEDAMVASITEAHLEAVYDRFPTIEVTTHDRQSAAPNSLAGRMRSARVFLVQAAASGVVGNAMYAGVVYTLDHLSAIARAVEGFLRFFRK